MTHTVANDIVSLVTGGNGMKTLKIKLKRLVVRFAEWSRGINMHSEERTNNVEVSARPRSEIVSEPGAAVTVIRVNLTDDERKSLSINRRLSEIFPPFNEERKNIE